MARAAWAAAAWWAWGAAAIAGATSGAWASTAVTLQDAAEELVHVDALIAQLSKRKSLLLDRLGLPDGALAALDAQFTPPDVFSAAVDAISGDVLFSPWEARFAVVASSHQVQVFDSDAQLVLELDGYEDVREVRAVSGVSPLLITLSNQGRISVQPLVVRKRVNSTGVAVELKSPPVSLVHEATSLDVMLLKNSPRIVLGTDRGKILVLDQHGDVLTSINASTSTDVKVTHVALAPLYQLAFALSDGTIGFSSALGGRPYGPGCALHPSQGHVIALAVDTSREFKYIYAATSTGELAVFDRHSKEPRTPRISIVPSSGGHKLSCELVHRVTKVHARQLATLGHAVLSLPKATVRSPANRWQRANSLLEGQDWIFARTAVDYKTNKDVMLVLFGPGRGAVLRPLLDPLLSGGKKDTNAFGGGSDFVAGLFSDRGPMMIIAGALGLMAVVGRGAGTFGFGRAPSSSSRGSSASRRSFVVSDAGDMRRSMMEGGVFMGEPE